MGIVLLVGAGLMLRTFQELRRADMGFRTDDVVTFRLSLPGSRYESPGSISRFTQDLEQRLVALPGVEAAGMINQLPMDDSPNWSTPYFTRENADRPEQHREADARVVTPGYLPAIGAGLRAGRTFDERDSADVRRVVIIDELLGG